MRSNSGVVRVEAPALEAEQRHGPAPGHVRLLVNEEAVLALQAPSVALEHPILANHAMTRNDDGDRIGADCSADVQRTLRGRAIRETPMLAVELAAS